jgi:hypothetical protein
MPYRSVLPCALVAMLLIACAGQLTPWQELTWDAYKACQSEGPSTRLDRVRENGSWYIEGREGEVFKVHNCMLQYRAEALKAGRMKATRTPQLTEASAKDVVRFAYFTSEPPAAGTYLRTSGFSNMPRKLGQFTRGPITFFYALQNSQSYFDGQILWLDPKGEVARKESRRLDQSNVSGAWSWWTDTLPQSVELVPGKWAVELRLNGVLAGRYEFTAGSP